MNFTRSTGLVRGYIIKIKKSIVGNNNVIYRIVVKTNREKEIVISTFDFDKLKADCLANFNKDKDEVIIEYTIRTNKFVDKENKETYYTSLMLSNMVVIKSSYTYVYEGGNVVSF